MKNKQKKNASSSKKPKSKLNDFLKKDVQELRSTTVTTIMNDCCIEESYHDQVKIVVDAARNRESKVRICLVNFRDESVIGMDLQFINKSLARKEKNLVTMLTRQGLSITFEKEDGNYFMVVVIPE